MDSLITIKFLVIAISAIPAISTYSLIERRNACQDFLTLYCGFKNNRSDYVAFDFTVMNENSTDPSLMLETEYNFKRLLI